MLIYIFLLVAIAVITYLIQLQSFSNSRYKALRKDFPVITGPTLRMNLSAETR